jgi:hypothetical protein
VHRRDVKDVGKGVADPSARVVLVRDGVDPQPRADGGELVLGDGVLELEEDLGEDVGAAPDQDPEGIL